VNTEIQDEKGIIYCGSVPRGLYFIVLYSKDGMNLAKEKVMIEN
jgi:hypothetical protein